MDINELCTQYDNEVNSERKQILKNKIITFCNENQDSFIPKTASEIYVSHLLGM